MSSSGTSAQRFPQWLPVLLVGLLVGADQALKAWALSNLQYGAPAIQVIPGVLDWKLTFNTGAAWSMFSGSAVVLAALRLLVGAGLLFYLWRRPQAKLLTILLSMIAAGAIGNAIDGFTQAKGVTDMIHAPFLSVLTRLIGQGDFPIFNLADMYVVLATLALLAVSFMMDNRTREASPGS